MVISQVNFIQILSRHLGSFAPYTGKQVTADSPILSALDSLALVAFLMEIEDELEKNGFLSCDLTDELLKLDRPPLTTVRQFADYLCSREQR